MSGLENQFAVDIVTPRDAMHFSASPEANRIGAIGCDVAIDATNQTRLIAYFLNAAVAVDDA